MRKKYSSILLTFLMGIILFPWQLFAFCPSHKEIHEEHHGNCEDGMMMEEDDHQGVTTYDGPVLKMADVCYTFSIATEDYQQSQNHTNLNIQQLAFIITYIQLQTIKTPDQPFPKLPDQRSNSDPPFEINTFRGPPVV